MSEPDPAPKPKPELEPAPSSDAAQLYDGLDFERAPVIAPVAAGEPSFSRALLLGGGAAVLGALVYFGVRALTGYELGLIAIGVGIAVGVAVRTGANGSPHRGFRILAIVLAYLSIASTYVPALIHASESPQVSLGLLFGASLFALAIPFMLLRSGEIMTVVIVGIALWEAWKFSAPQVVVRVAPPGPPAPPAP